MPSGDSTTDDKDTHPPDLTTDKTKTPKNKLDTNRIDISWFLYHFISNY